MIICNIHYLETQSVQECANFNITKSEDEFRKIRAELELESFNYCIFKSDKDSEIKISELNIEINPHRLVSEEFIKFDLMSGPLKNSSYSSSAIYPKKENFNHVLFFGDSKDKLILNYSFENDAWNVLETVCIDSSFELQDYSSVSSFSSGDILLTGGCQYTNYRNTAQKSTYLIKFNSKVIHIFPFKPMIVDRFSHGSLIIKDVPYVFGGHDGNETLSSLEYYDEKETKWKFLSFMNIEREIFAYCCVKQRYIYVFGGFNVNHLDTIERYDIVYDKWKLLNIKMKRPLQNATAVEIDYGLNSSVPAGNSSFNSTKIVLIGGYNGALHKVIDILDMETKTWTTLDYMQVPRRKSHCFKYKNRLHIFGGESSESETHIPEVYDFKNKVWGELSSYDSLVNRSLNFWCSTGIYI